jgi:hypothetical protein
MEIEYKNKKTKNKFSKLLFALRVIVDRLIEINDGDNSTSEGDNE